MTWKNGDWVRFNKVNPGPLGITSGMLGQIVGRDAIYPHLIVRFVHNQRTYNCGDGELTPVPEREALIEIAAQALLGPQDHVKIVRPPTFGVKP